VAGGGGRGCNVVGAARPVHWPTVAKRSTKAAADEVGTEPAAAGAGSGSRGGGKIPPVVILYGSDRSAQAEVVDDLRAQLKATHGEFDTVMFEAPGARAADVLDECRSLGLMVQRKLVIVNNAEEFVKEDDEEGSAPGEKTVREMFQAYCESPEPATTLVLRAAGKWTGGKLEKAALANGGMSRKCEPLSKDEAVALVMALAKEDPAGKARGKPLATPMSVEAAQRLVDAVGGSVGLLRSCVEKLRLAAVAFCPAGSAPAIGPKLVDLLVEMSREETIWAMQSSLLSGDPRRAMADLKAAVEISQHDEAGLSYAYVDLARKIDAAARMLKRGDNPMSVVGKLRLWGPGKDAAMDVARRVSTTTTATLLHSAVATDAAVKSGQGDPLRRMQVLTLRMARAFARPAR